MSRRRPSAIISCLILAGLAVLVCMISAWVVWLGDDIFFAFNLAVSDWLDKVDTFGEIIESQAYYYMNRNGRFVTHCVVQFFSGFAGQMPFALLNAAMWVAFVLVLARLSGVNWRQSPRGVLVLAILSFVCLRTQFTPPTQVNYIWAMTAALLIVEQFFSTAARPRWYALPALAVCSFLAGWGQESFSSGLAAAMWIYAVFHLRTMTWRQWSIVVPFTAGMLCLCLAPGNFAKLGTLSSLHITPVATAYFLRATYLLMALVLVLLVTHRVSLSRLYRQEAFWFNAMFFMMVFNLIVRVYCNRQLFGIEVVSIILLVKLLRRYPLTYAAWVKKAGVALLVALLALVVVDDFNKIAERRAVVDKIARLYQASPDGVVYCDIDDKDYWYYDEDPMNSVNSWSLYQLRRRWMADGNENKPLEWRPSSVRDLLGKRLDSQVIKLGEKQNIYLLVWDKQDTTSVFKITEEWRCGPVVATRYDLRYPVREIEDSRVDINIIRDTHYNAVVWRQNGVFTNCIDATIQNPLTQSHAKPQ